VLHSKLMWPMSWKDLNSYTCNKEHKISNYKLNFTCSKKKTIISVAISLTMNSCYNSFSYYMPHKEEREYIKDDNKYTKTFLENQLCQSWDKIIVSKTSSVSTIRRGSRFLSLVRSIIWEKSCVFIHYKNFKPKTVIKLEWIIDGFWTYSQLL